MTERILVTGGAGFIGSHVADAYLAEGYEVTVLDNLSTGRRENVPAAATFVHADIGSSEAHELLATGSFTLLNHHAAQMDVRVSVADPVFDAETNVVGLLNLLEGAREGRVRRVVFASSGGVVYGGSDTPPHSEVASKLPVSPYGVSKLAAEYYLTAYAQLYALDVVSLRYANVYGPRQNPRGEAGVVAIFSDRVRDRQPLTIFGDGNQTRDYVFVSDAARANLAATTWAGSPAASVDDVAFNVGTAVETSVRELADALLRVAGVDVPVHYGPARAGELQRSAVDITKAGRELGWTPEVVLADGLERTLEWIREDAA